MNILNDKKTKKIIQQTGLPIESVGVDNGSKHEKLLYLKDGSTLLMKKDGEIIKMPYPHK